MRKIFYLIAMAAFLLAACHDGKTGKAQDSDSTQTFVDDSDSTVYGVCGEGTGMHSLELVTNNGDTLNYLINMDDESTVQGGLMAGDRLAVYAVKNADGENEARSVINLTTLLGKWTSIDKNFEIQEGGQVESFVKAESHPYTSWRIYNGKLLLNADTFRIDMLGADSLYLENKTGIFAYKRQK